MNTPSELGMHHAYLDSHLKVLSQVTFDHFQQYAFVTILVLDFEFQMSFTS